MSVGELLKKAREEKNLTLRDISAKTKISEKFLEKIESESFDFAPEPYVRAFLRSYARVVGLNPDEIIKLYDSEISVLKPKEVKKEVEEKRKIQFDFASFVSENVLWLIGGVLVILLGIFVFISIGGEEKKEVKKKSFETAVEELSKRSEVQVERKETLSEIELDSLELKIIASDSVWMSVLIDSAQVKEFLMPPNTSLTLKAKNNFNFTIGNAGGVKFVLNGHDLEPPGRKGAVVRNYVIGREKLREISLHR